MGFKETIKNKIENTIFIDFLLKNGQFINDKSVRFNVIIPEDLHQQMTCTVTVWGQVSFGYISVDIQALKEMQTQINHVAQIAIKEVKEEKKTEKGATSFVKTIQGLLEPQKLYIFKTNENLA